MINLQQRLICGAKHSYKQIQILFVDHGVYRACWSGSLLYRALSGSFQCNSSSTCYSQIRNHNSSRTEILLGEGATEHFSKCFLSSARWIPARHLKEGEGREKNTWSISNCSRPVVPQIYFSSTSVSKTCKRQIAVGNLAFSFLLFAFNNSLRLFLL